MTSMNLLWKRNVKLLYFQTFFGNAYFDRAVFMLYLLSRGYSLLQIGILQSFVNVAMFICEIPTGMFADRFGRRISLLVGRLLIILHFIGMIFSKNFTMFSITFILLGVGVTFISGSEEALLYDSTKQANQEAEYSRYAGRYMAIMTLVLAIAMGAGGFMGELSWTLVFAASIVFQIAAILVTLFLKEASFEEEPNEPRSFSYIIRDTFAFLKINKYARALVIGIGLYIGVFSIYYLFAQQLFNEAGYPTYAISIIFAVVSLLSALVSDRAHLIEQRFSSRDVMYGSVVISAIIFLTIYFEIKWLSIVAFVLLNLIFCLYSPISNSLINSKIPSGQRATLLSVMNFWSSLLMFVLSPIMGYTSEILGGQRFVSLVGVLSMVIVYFCMVFFFKNHRTKSETDTLSSKTI